jgi:NADH dehydrogenase (ubiquinone) 1 beta subcomplex subunit 8
MASIVKFGSRSQLINLRRAVVYQIIRNHWNKDWKPGPYPKTPEERTAAAKKYNLSPEEYEPYPDDGMGHGDYPKLPDTSIESRDPFYPWDFPEHKRNFGEPVHVHVDMYGEDRFDVSSKPRYSLKQQFLAFIGVMAGCAGIYYWLEDKKMFRPVLPKQYAYQGETHYTFESAT